MPLSPETRKHHSTNPCDVGLSPEKKAAMTVGIVRQTSQTGEQIHIDCPVYAEDTREQLKARLGFCYSILQERLEEENEAVNFQNKRHQTMRMCKVADENNIKHKEKLFAKLEKSAKAQRWTEEKIAEEKKLIETEFDKAHKPNALKFAHAKAELEANDVLDLATFAKDNGFEDWTVGVVLGDTANA